MILGEESSGWTATDVDPSGETLSGRPLQPTSVGSSADPGMPTGPLPLIPTSTTSTTRVVTQTAVVVAAAFLVGTFVFLLVRAAVSSGSDDDSAVQDETSIIDPGPSEDDAALADSTRSGSRRSEGADGRDSDEEGAVDPGAPVVAADGGDDEAADGDDGLASASTTILAEAQADDPLQTSTSGPSTTFEAGQVPGATSTTANPNAATTIPTPGPNPTVESTTATIGPSTTAAPITTTTAATSTTTAAPASTVPSTTTAPPPPPPLIALPSDGDRRAWETFTRFRAKPVDRATQYCWTFVSGGGGQRRECSDGNLYDLPATPRGLLPGPLDVQAQALSADGTVLAEDKISISLIVGDVADDPNEGARVDLSDHIDLKSDEVRSADRYCWTIIQGAISTGEICDDDQQTRVDEDDPRLNGFSTGAARVQSTVYRGDDLIGSEGRRITFR